MREGDRLTVEKKIVGHYVMEAIKPNDTVVFMGTGTGEAPHNAMVTELLSQGHQGRIVTATCVRKREDLGYLSMHRELERKYPSTVTWFTRRVSQRISIRISQGMSASSTCRASYRPAGWRPQPGCRSRRPTLMCFCVAIQK